jgi:hypothetical protein
MNTRLLMRASVVFLGVLGIAATFLPEEILVRAGTPPVGLSVILVQITGALYLGFAMLNWMAQGNMIGGIYSRPVAIGNLAHFTIGGLGLLRSLLAGKYALEVIAVTAGYAAFAVLFALVAFRHSPPSRVDA